MKKIGIWGDSASVALQPTFDALGQAFGVSFERRQYFNDHDVDAWIVLAAKSEFTSMLGSASKPCYIVADQADLLPGSTSTTLQFTDRSELDPVLRGRRVAVDDAADVRALPRWLHNVAPLAFKESSPVWAVQEDGVCRHHWVSLVPPVLDPGEPLFSQLCARRFARLLPLVLFVRTLVEGAGWEPPPLQAAFMFDDPNLHWTSYGFIDFCEMIRRASAGNYHVSFATIPLDSWFVYRPAASIFKASSDRVSLLCHGNDHVSNELGRSRSAEDMHNLLRQAVARLAAMEATTGLDVARVMAPPHGACSQTAIDAMAQVGFEALCISRGSLRFHNPNAGWTRAIGVRPCDVIRGLTVIPRFGLSNDCRNDILIAALLRQPIVPITHHQAVSDGYHLLDETASFINSLGAVSWQNLKSISRSLYSQRNQGDTLHVRMFSKRITIRLPEGVTSVHVERPWLDAFEESLSWRSENTHWNRVANPGNVVVPEGTSVEIVSGVPQKTQRTNGSGPRRFRPVARRLLTEGRDRVLPSLHRIAGRQRTNRPA